MGLNTASSNALKLMSGTSLPGPLLHQSSASRPNDKLAYGSALGSRPTMDLRIASASHAGRSW